MLLIERTLLLPRFIAAENNFYAISIFIGNVVIDPFERSWKRARFIEGTPKFCSLRH